MHRRMYVAFIAGVLFALVCGNLSAALIVNPPQPITRRVTVQLVQTALDNATSPATVFGNAAQRASIEAGIDAIWAQAGIDVDVLPPITRYNNTFAYQGNAGSGVRPTGDLDTIYNNARNTGGVLNSDTRVLNLFLVNVVPGFAPLSEFHVAGLARQPGNIITGFVGDNLLSTQFNLDIVAGVVAHEIGHNLNLTHTASGTANLMSISNGTSQQLSSAQITTALSSNYARAFTTPITGDYNANGRVDAADYILWRNTANQTGSGLPADGNGSGSVDTVDFSIWRSHFNNVRGASGAGTAVEDSAIGTATTAPEPATVVLLIFALPWLMRRNPRVAAGRG